MGDDKRFIYFLRLTGVVLTLVGLPLLVGGVWLAVLGGSIYYVAAGMARFASAVLIALRRMTGVWIYGAFLATTIVWALWEVGLDFWLLVPRLVVPLVLAILVVLCLPALESGARRRQWARAGTLSWIASILGLTLVGIGASIEGPRHTVVRDAPTIISGDPSNTSKKHGTTMAVLGEAPISDYRT